MQGAVSSLVCVEHDACIRVMRRQIEESKRGHTVEVLHVVEVREKQMECALTGSELCLGKLVWQ